MVIIQDFYLADVEDSYDNEDILDSAQIEKPYLDFLVSVLMENIDIGNDMNTTGIDLQRPSAPSGRIAARERTKNPLPVEILQGRGGACGKGTTYLRGSKKSVSAYIASRIGSTAPNLTAIVGSSVAASLIVHAGGLSSLASMPPSGIQSLGAGAGAELTTPGRGRGRVGYLGVTEIFQGTQRFLRKYVGGLLAQKVSLAAFLDICRSDPTGGLGESMRNCILKRIEGLQKPKPHIRPKYSPMRKQSGRLRVVRSSVTELSEMMSRMSFGDAKPKKLGPKVDSKFKRNQMSATSSTLALANQLESSTGLSELAEFSNLRI